jgi:hypothetical protein
MKYSQKISLLFLSLLLTTACQDQLDLTPISGISVDTYFNNPTEVKSEFMLCMMDFRQFR